VSTPVLNERFAESGGEAVEVDGLTVHPMFRAEIRDGDEVRVFFESAAADREQGLVVKVTDGELDVGGRRAQSFLLWRDESPTDVELLSRGEGELRVWNAWRSDGLIEEWSGNAGVLVEDDGETVTLHMSDGIGEPSFDDLVVNLEIARAGSE